MFELIDLIYIIIAIIRSINNRAQPLHPTPHPTMSYHQEHSRILDPQPHPQNESLQQQQLEQQALALEEEIELTILNY